MFCGGGGSKSAKGGPNLLADMDREGPNPLADLERGVQIRCDTGIINFHILYTPRLCIQFNVQSEFSSQLITSVDLYCWSCMWPSPTTRSRTEMKSIWSLEM